MIFIAVLKIGLNLSPFLSSRVCTLYFVSPLQPISTNDDAKLPIFSTTKKGLLEQRRLYGVRFYFSIEQFVPKCSI